MKTSEQPKLQPPSLTATHHYNYVHSGVPLLLIPILVGQEHFYNPKITFSFCNEKKNHVIRSSHLGSAKEDRYDVAPFTTGVVKPPAPFNLTVFKSYRETVLNRSFAEFVVRSTVSRGLLRWLEVVDKEYPTNIDSVHLAMGCPNSRADGVIVRKRTLRAT